MTSHLDPDLGFDPRVANWLEADPLDAPGAILETVLAAVPSIPQRRSMGLPRRLGTTNRVALLAAAVGAATAIAVLAVAVGGAWNSRQSSGAPSAPASPSLAPSVSPSARSPEATAKPAVSAMWTATGNMVEIRFGESATLLPNGKALVVGGRSNWGGHGFSRATAELYDPSTGRWSLTGSMHDARQEHAAVLLTTNKVLVLGGDSSGGGLRHLLSSAELYDLSSGTWTETGGMTTARANATATVLPDGRVLVAGGDSSSAEDPQRSAEVYDPATGEWTTTTSMSVSRTAHTATLLADGRVLVAGGGCCSQSARASAELYDPAIGTWARAGALGSARVYHAAIMLAGGKVLVYGGDNRSDHPPVTTAELFDPVTGMWVTTGSPHGVGTRFEALGAVVGQPAGLPDGRVLAAGYGAAGELYSPASASWSSVGGLSGDLYIYVHTSTPLADGRVLVTYEPAAALFDPEGTP